MFFQSTLVDCRVEARGTFYKLTFMNEFPARFGGEISYFLITGEQES